MEMHERTVYQYLLPRGKRKLTNYVQAILGIPALILFILSLYLVFMGDTFYLMLSAMGLFFSRQFIYTISTYIMHENLSLCLAVDSKAIGFGFDSDKPKYWISIEGVYVIELEDDNWWVIRHRNGTWIYFPNDLMLEEDLTFLTNSVYDSE
ncbi:MAG TPA: hypothetical protein ENK66_09240 [Arcobacter sp.]|nr:hypothetical protein [Arcobacter sp.]